MLTKLWKLMNRSVVRPKLSKQRKGIGKQTICTWLHFIIASKVPELFDFQLPLCLRVHSWRLMIIIIAIREAKSEVRKVLSSLIGWHEFRYNGVESKPNAKHERERTSKLPIERVCFNSKNSLNAYVVFRLYLSSSFTCTFRWHFTNAKAKVAHALITVN